jgi:hypothetical protein
MLGSNSAGESMPVHIMFTSKAKDEGNYQINPKWIIGIPRVHGFIGHEEEKSFPATITVNPKGGTGSRVLMQYLNSVMGTLYPNASDTAGCCVLFKIDGGPGQFRHTKSSTTVIQGMPPVSRGAKYYPCHARN